MTVVILLKQYREYGPPIPIGVFSSKEEANKHIPEDPVESYYYMTTEFELDRAPK